MAGEGNPCDPAQARSQMSEHAKVEGLLLDQRGRDSDDMPSRSSPVSLTWWNVAESLPGRMEMGRQKQLLSRSVYRFGQLLTPRRNITGN